MKEVFHRLVRWIQGVAIDWARDIYSYRYRGSSSSAKLSDSVTHIPDMFIDSISELKGAAIGCGVTGTGTAVNKVATG